MNTFHWKRVSFAVSWSDKNFRREPVSKWKNYQSNLLEGREKVYSKRRIAHYCRDHTKWAYLTVTSAGGRFPQSPRWWSLSSRQLIREVPTDRIHNDWESWLRAYKQMLCERLDNFWRDRHGTCPIIFLIEDCLQTTRKKEQYDLLSLLTFNIFRNVCISTLFLTYKKKPRGSRTYSKAIPGQFNRRNWIVCIKRIMALKT
jgi:hypothetical protein